MIDVGSKILSLSYDACLEVNTRTYSCKLEPTAEMNGDHVAVVSFVAPPGVNWEFYDETTWVNITNKVQGFFFTEQAETYELRCTIANTLGDGVANRNPPTILLPDMPFQVTATYAPGWADLKGAFTPTLSATATCHVVTLWGSKQCIPDCSLDKDMRPAYLTYIPEDNTCALGTPPKVKSEQHYYLTSEDGPICSTCGDPPSIGPLTKYDPPNRLWLRSNVSGKSSVALSPSGRSFYFNTLGVPPGCVNTPPMGAVPFTRHLASSNGSDEDCELARTSLDGVALGEYSLVVATTGPASGSWETPQTGLDVPNGVTINMSGSTGSFVVTGLVSTGSGTGTGSYTVGALDAVCVIPQAGATNLVRNDYQQGCGSSENITIAINGGAFVGFYIESNHITCTLDIQFTVHVLRTKGHHVTAYWTIDHFNVTGMQWHAGGNPQSSTVPFSFSKGVHLQYAPSRYNELTALSIRTQGVWNNGTNFGFDVYINSASGKLVY